jgi:pimeloyl-ACP methyl ester carboxylesterase
MTGTRVTGTTLTRTQFVDGLRVVGYHPDNEKDFAPAVVLLHGISGSADSCAPLARILADLGVHAWCLDAAGYGESADPTSLHHDYVGDALTVAAAVSDGRPTVLVGTSWGGVIAAGAAIRRPDLVAGLVLADSTRGSGTSPAKADAMRARAAEMMLRSPAELADERAYRLVAPGADPAIAESVRTSMASVRLPGFSAAAEFMASTDLGPRLGHIACATTVVVGEADVITGVEESRLLAEAIPGAELHEIIGAGHVAIQEQPAIVAVHVLGLLGTLS